MGSPGAAAPVLTLSRPDAGELLTLQRAAYVTEARRHDDHDLPPLTQTLDELRAELASPSTSAWGVRDGGRLIASVRVALDGPVAHLGRLVTAPDRQGEGLGTRLLRHVEEHLPGDVERILLFTGEHSDGPLRLYARHGYVETHRSDAGTYALVHLTKRLTSPAP